MNDFVSRPYSMVDLRSRSFLGEGEVDVGGGGDVDVCGSELVDDESGVAEKRVPDPFP